MNVERGGLPKLEISDDNCVEGLKETTSNLVWKVSESRFEPATRGIRSSSAKLDLDVWCFSHRTFLLFDVTTDGY
jgi:hypothetical protein